MHLVRKTERGGESNEKISLMAIVRGGFSSHWLNRKIFWDECSPIRHFFAKLGFCKHKGEWLNMKQYFHKVYEGIDGGYKSIFLEKEDD